VAGAADALQPGGDRLGRLDLEHEVDGAHVDAELERRGGDEARQLAGLEQLLDDEPLLARSEPWWARAIGSSASSFKRKREPLRRAAVVDEDDRRAVRAHLLEQLGVDRGPDRLARRLPAGERVEVEV
jgi:hypothetical protein